MSTFDPGLDGKVLELQIGRVSYVDRIANAVKHKSLTDTRRTVDRIPNQRAGVGPNRVQCIIFPFPPAHQTRWRGRARRRRWRAFTRAAGVVDGLDFRSSKGAGVNGRPINHSEEGPGTRMSWGANGHGRIA